MNEQINNWWNNLPTPQKDFLLCLEGMLVIIIISYLLSRFR